MQYSSAHQAGFLLGGALLATFWFHWGVLRGIEGIGLALFFLVILGVLECILVAFKLRTNTWARIFLLPFAFSVINAALYAHDLTRVFSVLIGWASFTLYAYWSTTVAVPWRELARLTPTTYLSEAVFPVESTKTPFTLWKEHSTRAFRILIGCLVVLPILLFLGDLFAAADPVFRQLVENFLPNIPQSGEFIGRLIFDAVFGIAFARGLWLVLTRKSEERTKRDADPETRGPSPFHSDITTTILAAMSVFVGLFVTVQIRVMLGGEAWMRSMNYTYAEYARNGYGQMVVACGLIGAVLLALYLARSLQSRSARWLSYTLIAEAVLILMAAWGRLARYIDAYSLTTDRLWANIFIIALGLGAAWLAWSLARGYAFGRFSTVLTIGMMTYFVAVPCLLNIEGRVVSANVYTREANRLDLNYISRLSSDGLLTLRTWERYYAYNNGDARRILKAEAAQLRLRSDEAPLSLTLQDYRLLRELDRDAANGISE